MTYQSNPYAAVAMLSAVVAFVTAVNIHWKRSAPGARYLMLLMVTIGEYCACASLESAAVGIPAKLFWSKLQYVGVASAPTFLLLFALAYNRQSKRIENRWVYLLLVVPFAIIAAAWTNERHGMLWSSLTLAPGEDNILIYGHGPVYFIAVAYYTIVFVASAAVLLVPAQSMAIQYRQQVAGVAAAFVPPWVLGTVYTLDPSLVRYLDVMPIGLLFTGLILNWSLMRYRILDLVPMARDTMVEGMSDGLVVLDAKERIVDMNPAALHLLELASGPPIGVAVDVALSKHPRLIAEIRSKRETRMEICWDDYGSRFLDVYVSALRGRNETVEGRLLILRDVTERKRLEEQLLSVSRLETAGQIAAQVSHDFNNLLAPMTAYPDLIKMQLPDDHPAIQYCDAMQESAQIMSQINEDMMVLGRRGHFDFEPTDLNHVVKQALAQLPDPPETQQTVLDLAPNLLPVRGSPAQLLRVVMNLVSNAREAMADGGTLSIKTENVYLDTAIIRLTRVEIGEYVKLSVSDTGCGIPNEIRNRIFDVFFTARRGKRKRGSGLGLAIVQSVVSDHRGYVDLESEPGKGTTFYVYLPVCRDGIKEAPQADLPRGTETILIVDDDQIQREAATRMLRVLGYRTNSVASGEAALESLREQKVDLLLLDMVMPDGIDGAETYRRALEIRPGQRAIIISGYAESDRVVDAQALGAGSYVRKPVTLEKLARAVRRELDRT